ncbi:MAG TPA: FKBP-type peptidyl-prolyl cis-trans isomerase [Ferruginibacter sp.]|nr:FKBP-type peptidyl-prolyl cis-trans isomerase [Ferruginibacter sp.]
MKYSCLLFLANIFCVTSYCQNHRTTRIYTIPDSIQATGFYAETTMTDSKNSKKNISGICVNEATIRLEETKDEKLVELIFFDNKGKDIAFGSDVYPYGLGNAWKYDWQYDVTYPLLILTASDSAKHNTVFSGYIFLPKENKWKLISTRLYQDTISVKFLWPGSNEVNKKSSAVYSNRWLLRSNNTWKAMDDQTSKPPVLRPLMRNVDSLFRQKTEEDEIRARLKDSATYKEGIFYRSFSEGTGRPINLTDTLVVHYKGSLFSDGSVFDQTKEKPATFPLGRLIKGWQLGLTQCRVGGKIRLYIPSGSAYGIRTLSTAIPPNSILVFDVEVLDAKEKR